MSASRITVLKNLAEQQGNRKAQVEACRSLSDAYYKGTGVEKDEEEAVKWLTKAAEMNDAWAQYNLGICCDKGTGVARSYEKAFEWYQKAAGQGYANAQYNLGVCYQQGTGVAQSYEKAFKWCQKAADQGHAKAQFNLGACYQEGAGVAQSYEKAIEWYHKAADQGDARAQHNLGNCYYNGQGVVQNYEKAVEWYHTHKAADQGYADAQFNLGTCYEDGQGVKKNLKKAKRFYTLAAKQGDVSAHAALARLEAASSKGADMKTTLKHIHKARAALADGSASSGDRRIAQWNYEQLASLLCCRNEGCSVSYTDDVSAQTAKKLKSCSACRKVAYCSTGCQTVDWKARHRHECGKKLEVGEEFVLASLVSRAELNGCRVVVERGMDAATGQVGVRIVAEAEPSDDGDDDEEEESNRDNEERKAEGSKKPASSIVVGVVISVEPMNLQKAPKQAKNNASK